MKCNRSKIVFVVILVVVGILYLTGYRLTGLQAAKLHPTLGKTPDYIDRIDYDWGRVYLFHTDLGPRTVISERYGILWVARVGFHMNDSIDNIRVIGWGNNENCTVYAVKVFDDNIKYIEMGIEPNRVRQYVNDESHIIFHWDTQLIWNDFNGIAYTSNHQPIYELRYPKDTSHINPTDDLRWYPIREEEES